MTDPRYKDTVASVSPADETIAGIPAPIIFPVPLILPRELYKAVAHVLTYILQLKAWRSGRRERPELIQNVPIHEEL